MTRVVTLRNVLPDKNVEFHWEDGHALVASGIVTFIPQNGVIPPNDFALLRIQVTANANPIVVNNFFALRLKDSPIAKVRRAAH